MKPNKRFWLWCLGIALFVLFAPLIITALMFYTSNYIHPIFFIVGLVAAAALISFFGGIGRND